MDRIDVLITMLTEEQKNNAKERERLLEMIAKKL